MTRKNLLLAGALSIAAAGGIAATAHAFADHKGPMRADTNGDGIVSRGEFFAAAQARFQSRDANGDRTLSGDELKDRRGRFARQDANNDGVLSFAEAATNTAARFGRLDADHDGKLTPEELGPHGPRPGGPADLAQDPAADRPAPGGMGLARLDTNGDGKVTREEMRAQADQRFDRLDTNHDGVIDQTELQAMRAGMGPRGFGRRGGMDDMPPPPPPPGQDD